MSKYNSYAKRVNDIARGAFAEYNTALEAFNTAKKAYTSHPYVGMTTGAISAENAASLARAKADYLMAQTVLDAAKNKLQSGKESIRGIQREFVDALEKDVRIDPSKLDMGTLEILKSGIVRPEEYSKLIADNANNPTMIRMIASYAKKDSENVIEKSAKFTLLRAIEESKNASGDAYRESFDNLCGTYDHCANNPLMIGHWEEFTAETVENF